MENKNKLIEEKFGINLKALGDSMLAARNVEQERFYLDKETGEILRIYQATPDSDCEPLSTFRKIYGEGADRYADIPEIDTFTELQWMSEFAEFVDNDLHSELKQLLDVSDKIKAFNELLKEHPEDAVLWHYQRESHKWAEAHLFLEEEGIEEGERFYFDRETNELKAL